MRGWGGLDDTSIEEADWYDESRVWMIPDFFEMMKDQFRSLSFTPAGPMAILEADDLSPQEAEALRAIYQEHGWPNLDRCP